jgi:CHAT domain-containing protein
MATAAIEGRTQLLVDVARRAPQVAREFLEDRLLPDWGRAMLNRQSTASQLLQVSVVLAEALTDRSGDPLPLAAVQRLAAQSSPLGQAGVMLLAEAHQIYGEGRAHYERARFSQGAALFARAVKLFDRAASPFRQWAAVNLAIGEYYDGRFDEALLRLDSLEPLAVTNSYVLVTGRIQWVRGLIAGGRGRLGEALHHYDRAMSAYVQAGEEGNAAAVHSLLADANRLLGELDIAWSEHARAVSAGMAIRSRSGRYASLVSASITALRKGLPRTALELQNDAVALAAKSGIPLLIGESLQRRAQILAQLARIDEASRDLERALDSLADVDSANVRSRLEAEIQATLGESLTIGQRPDGPAAVLKAISYLERNERLVRLPRLYLMLARAELARGRIDQAELALERGLSVLERHRAQLTQDRFRISYMEDGWPLVAAMVDLQWRHKGDPWRAFAYADRGRARALRDLTGPEVPDVSADVIARALPHSVVLVYYAVLPDRLLIWVLGRDGRRSTEVPVGREEIAVRVSSCIRKMQIGSTGEEIGRALTDLYVLLVEPIEAAIGSARTLIVSPDAELHGLPFAALQHPRTGRHLVETYSVALTPAAAMLAQPDRRSALARKELKAAVAAPRLDVSSPAGLPDLPYAQKEADLVAGLYPGAEVLTPSDWAPNSFSSAMARADIVHFAGHAVANPDFPLLSRLVLPIAAPGDGALLAHEISALDLSKTELVMLSACRTAGGRIRLGEGVASLARAFLAAGVQSVVATLWDVEDRSAADMAVKFHSLYRTTRNAPVSLAETQRRAIESSTHPRPSFQWAAFVAVVRELSLLA